MQALELLAPARNKDIGIAAIDCGADAVYIAGPDFGARQAAGNPVGDIAELCRYAHRFGARIFVTLNTILFEDELDRAGSLVRELADAGVDALIVQDLGVITLNLGTRLPLHASTQCSVRTPEKAAFMESLGFSRIVLERQMSLEGIRAVREAVGAEIEFFVHGALCVCYSGECYLSERIAGRSANRGGCIQACRSRYDLVDGSGKVLVRDKALLSLKDYNLIRRLGDLAEAGVCSFKIEGRLKNISYVRNVVREYSIALDELVRKHPDRYRRSSFGTVRGGFSPDPRKTFNRGYTELYLDGTRGPWAAMDTPKSIGEPIGTVRTVSGGKITVSFDDPGTVLANGDGFVFVSPREGMVGFRGDVCSRNTIQARPPEGLRPGMRLFRNISAAFEKELQANRCVREIDVFLALDLGDGRFSVTAETEDGRTLSKEFETGPEAARDRDRMADIILGQLSKRTGGYAFSVRRISAPGAVPMMGASFLNGVRRELAAELDRMPVHAVPMRKAAGTQELRAPERITYKENVSNSLSEALYRSRGAVAVEKAYELTHCREAELMRTKYCIRYELGLCPVHQGARPTGPLFLLNNGLRLSLGFDCKACEMTVSEG
ncbi:MAG: U32 family peptidase [Bacteroidales bacterium]|nr:U32 family peptidase [Bacteroidales bacterium]